MNSKHRKTLTAVMTEPVNNIITFHGTSVTAFEEALHSAVDSYMAACEQFGQAAEKPASGRLMLRVDPSVHAAALKASARHGQSLNKWAEQAMLRALMWLRL